MPIPDAECTILAAGGQEAEIHMALYAPSGRSCYSWSLDDKLHASINNSVVLASLNLSRSTQSAIEPRLVVSNNDGTVKVFDVPLRTSHPRKLEQVGTVSLNVPVNHCMFY